MNWNALRDCSYTPYSGKSEACVVEGESGLFYTGVRVENISFPETIQASQSAIFTCLSEKDRPVKLIIPKNYQENRHILNFWEDEYNLTIIIEDSPPEKDRYHKILSLKSDITDQLIQLLDFAIVPNSNFPVSAILEVEDGFITGVNAECSEWSLGLCAERLAIAKAIAMGYRTFKRLYVHTKYGEYSSPCGACRQVINEQMPNKPVYLYHANHSHSYHDISQLLPYSFQTKYLKKISE